MSDTGDRLRRLESLVEEQQETIDDLRAETEELRAENDRLRERNAELESRLNRIETHLGIDAADQQEIEDCESPGDRADAARSPGASQFDHQRSDLP